MFEVILIWLESMAGSTVRVDLWASFTGGCEVKELPQSATGAEENWISLRLGGGGGLGDLGFFGEIEDGGEFLGGFFFPMRRGGPKDETGLDFRRRVRRRRMAEKALSLSLLSNCWND